jgi:signal transduction histidine kinase
LSGTIEDEAVVLKVMNRGAGIAAEEQKLIFEPFYRGNRGEEHKGFGLGLSSVKSVVEAHGWEITLSSDPGEITAFSIIVPLTTASA